MSKLPAWLLALASSCAVLGQSCLESIEVGRDFARADQAGSAGSGGLSVTAGAPTVTGGAPTVTGGGPNASGGASSASGGAACQVTHCQGKLYLCGDCMDNDGDQLVDSDDPDCTGPCDNTEDSYFGGIPGQNNVPCRQDCYFDQDTGSGNDHCEWSQTCDPHSVAPAYPPSGDSHCAYDPSAVVPGSGATCSELDAAQASTCLDYCLPITPNGCDCFGCCELPADSGKFVWIGASSHGAGTCDAGHVDDPSACPPCTQVKSCVNDCDPCEVCVGRSAPLAGCASMTTSRCPANEAACGQPGEPACATDSYCITGCCAPAPR